MLTGDYRRRFVRTPDNVSVAVREWGPAAGMPIVFVHGFGQCGLAWRKQAKSVLAERFRLIAYDLRGHGDSSKPFDRDCYQQGRCWADELAAVLTTCQVDRAVLVAWSFGGTVVADYLNHYGQQRLAAINFVAASTTDRPEFVGPGRRDAQGIFADDLATSIDAVRGFVRGCFARLPAPEELETILAYNMAVPSNVRALMTGRPVDCINALRRLSIPVLVTHGTLDRLVLPAMSEYTKGLVPRARLSLYDGIGHSPFWEDAARFNRELEALADEVFLASDDRN